MRKLIDTLAVLSFVVSAGIVAAGVTVYVKKDAIIDHVKAQAQEQITGFVTDAVSDAVDGALTGGLTDGLLGESGGEGSTGIAGGALPPVTLPF